MVLRFDGADETEALAKCRAVLPELERLVHAWPSHSHVSPAAVSPTDPPKSTIRNNFV